MRDFIICDSGRVKEIAPKCIQYGSGIELQAFYDPEFLIAKPDSIQAHNNLTSDIKIRTLHGPFADLCFGSFDTLIREATNSRFNLAYDVAKKLDCTEIVLHHGYVPGTSPHGSWVKRGSTFWIDFFQDKGDNIKIHLENMLELDPYVLKDIIESVDNNNLDVCLDIGHAHCNSKTDVVDWIKILQDKIGYVHLHNNNGERDEHLGINMGTAPIKDICEELEINSPNASWAIESSHHIESSVEWLIRNKFLSI